MAVHHIAGVLEPSEVIYHLLTSHSLRDPYCLSKNLTNSLGKGTPLVQRSLGRGLRVGVAWRQEAQPHVERCSQEDRGHRQGWSSLSTWPVHLGNVP